MHLVAAAVLICKLAAVQRRAAAVGGGFRVSRCGLFSALVAIYVIERDSLADICCFSSLEASGGGWGGFGC